MTKPSSFLVSGLSSGSLSLSYRHSLQLAPVLASRWGLPSTPASPTFLRLRDALTSLCPANKCSFPNSPSPVGRESHIRNLPRSSPLLARAHTNLHIKALSLNGSLELWSDLTALTQAADHWHKIQD